MIVLFVSNQINTEEYYYKSRYLIGCIENYVNKIIEPIENKLEHIIEDGEILNEQYFDPQYGIVKPTLKVSYYRSYFSFNSMRITFDDKITYKTKKTDFRRVYHDPERVIEIKTPANCPDDYIENQIPFATSRFSKFSRGLLMCSGDLNEI